MTPEYVLSFSWPVEVFLDEERARELAGELNAWCVAQGIDPGAEKGAREGWAVLYPDATPPRDPHIVGATDTGTGYRVRPVTLKVPSTTASLLAVSVLMGEPDWGLLDKLMEERTQT